MDEVRVYSPNNDPPTKRKGSRFDSTVPEAMSDVDRLFIAARSGDVNSLNQMLASAPNLLARVPAITVDTPLHVAARHGNSEFVRQLLRLKPSFAKEVNNDGFTALNLAIENGNSSIAKELIAIDPSLCLLQDKDGRTPLHWAAIRGHIEIIKLVLDACESCVGLTTARGETAMDLALKNNQDAAYRVLKDCCSRKNLLINNSTKEETDSGLNTSISSEGPGISKDSSIRPHLRNRRDKATMLQKISIKVSMEGNKCRAKALKVVAAVDGTQSVAIEGENRDLVVVVGEGIDAVALTSLLRKKIGYASLLSVQEVKSGKSAEITEEGEKFMPAFYEKISEPVYNHALTEDSNSNSCTIS